MHNLIKVNSIPIICLILYFSSAIYPQSSRPDTLRIVSLGPYITEEIYLLGVENQLVGDTIYCVIPEAAKKIEKVGDVVNINIEKIISLKPGIIFATSLTSRQNIETMTKLGLNVISLNQPANFSEICSQFLHIGILLGQKNKAERIIATAKRKVTSIIKRTNNLPKKKVFLEVGVKPLFTQTKDSYVNDLIEFAGGINISREASSGFISYETVLAANPDVIIIAGMGMELKNEIKEWQKYKTLKAVKNAAIFSIDTYSIGSSSPVNFSETIIELVKMIHPEIELGLSNE